MKLLKASVIGVGLLMVAFNASALQQTVCFSKTKDDVKIEVYGERRPELKQMSVCELPSTMTLGSIGDTTVMCGGLCEGRTLSQMNKSGWRLIHVIEGLQGGFGMVFEKLK